MTPKVTRQIATGGGAVLAVGLVAAGITQHLTTGTDAAAPRAGAVPSFSVSAPTSTAQHSTAVTTPSSSTPSSSTPSSSTPSSKDTALPRAVAKAAPPIRHAPKAADNPGVLSNPDDATGADKRAAYKGSTGYGGTKPTKAQRKYTDQKRTNTPQKMPANRVLVPSIGIYASVIPEKTTAGYLTIPTQLNRVAWGTMTPSLASVRGTTMLAGHVTFNGVPGPFNKLATVKGGTAIYTTDSHGRLHAWRVNSMRSQPKTADWRIDVSGKRQLMLITCGGPEGRVNPAPGQSAYAHLNNVIVTATPVAVK